MKAIRIHAARAMSLILVVAGLATATSANAQHESGYDRNAQLITGLAIGAVAGYALLEAHDRHKDRHKHSKKYHDRHGHGHHDHYRYERRHGHYGDRHYRYHYGKKYNKHHRHDNRCGHGHKKHYHKHGHKHHKRDHGVYKIREDYHGHRGSHHKRVTVTHF